MDAPKVSVETLLPEDAKKPLDRNQVELVARGLLRPNAGMVQRLAIDYCKAMDLLGRSCETMENPDCVPDVRWLGEYYTLRGDHMICTDEGWEPGEGKAEYMKDPDYLPEWIVAEVNAPA